ncbi:MAG: hypothetical protein WDO69_10965 [Pseudomonadota bacterium]
MFNLRSVFAFWAVVALVLGSAERAQAQLPPTTGNGVTVMLPMTGVTRDHQDRDSTTPITQINYKDCLTDDKVTFSLNLGVGYNQYALQVWAGTGCDTFANRQPATATCWQLSGGGQPNMLVFPVTVSVRDMLHGRTGGQSVGGGVVDGTGGTDSTGTGGSDSIGGTGGIDPTAGTGGTTGTAGSSTSAPPSDAPSECILTSAVVAPQQLNVYFLLVDGANNSAGFTYWAATYKLSASAPPDQVSSGTGENIAPISWSYNDTNPDQYINGYQFYCDPAPGEAGLADAGVVPDPLILPTICQPSTVLIPGTRPPDEYRCGSAGRTSQKGNATGLINNVAYNVAVAATDTYRNIGNIGTTACAVPQPVTGFFEAYRNAGGEGGGGFCSFSRHGRPVLLLTVFGIALGLILRRRRAT